MTGYLTATEAARALGVSLQTVLRRIEAGAIRAERAGRRTWLVSATEVERLRRASPEPSTTRTHGEGADSEAILRPERGRLTPEKLAHLKDLQRRIWGTRRLPESSTELVRRAREERTAELLRRQGITHDEPAPSRDG